MKRWVKYSMRESKRAELAINLVAGMILISDRLELVTLLVVLFFVYLYHLVWIRRTIHRSPVYLRLRHIQHLADNRLELLRTIAELAYAYGSNKEGFYQKVCEAMRLSELKRRQIIDFETFKQSHNHLPLSKKDIDFYCLLEAGFSHRELSTIYGHSNFRSVYVKKNRILHKIKSNGHSDDVGEETEGIDMGAN